MWYARAVLDSLAVGADTQTAAEALATERANAAALRAQLEAELAAAHRERRERSAGATPSQNPNSNPIPGSNHGALPERHAGLSPGRRAPSSVGRRRGSREGLTSAGASPTKDPRQLKRPLQMAPAEGPAQPGPHAPHPDEGLGVGDQPRPLAAAERGPAALWQRLWACAGDVLALLLRADAPHTPDPGSRASSTPGAMPGRPGAAIPMRRPPGHAHAARQSTTAADPAPSPDAAGQAESAHLDLLRQRLRDLGAGAGASLTVFTAACAFLRRALPGERGAPASAASGEATREGLGQPSVPQHAAAEAALVLVRALLQNCDECCALALASCGALHEGEGPGYGADSGSAAQPNATGGLAQGIWQGSALADAARLGRLSSRITLVGPSGPLALAAAPAASALAGGKGGRCAWRGSEAALGRCGAQAPDFAFTLWLPPSTPLPCSTRCHALSDCLRPMTAACVHAGEVGM